MIHTILSLFDNMFLEVFIRRIFCGCPSARSREFYCVLTSQSIFLHEPWWGIRWSRSLENWSGWSNIELIIIVSRVSSNTTLAVWFHVSKCAPWETKRLKENPAVSVAPLQHSRWGFLFFWCVCVLGGTTSLSRNTTSHPPAPVFRVFFNITSFFQNYTFVL